MTRHDPVMVFAVQGGETAPQKWTKGQASSLWVENRLAAQSDRAWATAKRLLALQGVARRRRRVGRSSAGGERRWQEHTPRTSFLQEGLRTS